MCRFDGDKNIKQCAKKFIAKFGLNMPMVRMSGVTYDPCGFGNDWAAISFMDAKTCDWWYLSRKKLCDGTTLKRVSIDKGFPGCLEIDYTLQEERWGE